MLQCAWYYGSDVAGSSSAKSKRHHGRLPGKQAAIAPDSATVNLDVGRYDTAARLDTR